MKLPTPAHPDLKTGISSEAVAHNSKILEENNFNLKQLIDKNMHTTMRYGSEFRPTEILEKLYGEHRYWKRVKRNIDMGVHYEVKKLPQKKRRKLMMEAMEYGNHKSAKENEELCVELASKDATLGYSAVFPVSCAEKIANGEIYPLGIQFQNAVNEFGEIY